MNNKLAKERGISTTQGTNIKALHVLRDELMLQLKVVKVSSLEHLKLLEKWRDIEYTLQGLWGFKQNQNKHQSWKLPHCSCPNMDNSDIGMHYYHTINCPSCALLTQLDETFISMSDKSLEKE